MNTKLIEDLKSLECAGNIAKLPASKLNDYATLKKTLIKACGKYKRNYFEFPFPAQVIINKLISGDSINFKKEFQFFATPPQLAEEMANQIIFDKETIECLEPSGGHGVLIDAVLNRNPSIKKHFDVVELSELNEAVLRDKYKNNGIGVMIFGGDFMQIDFHKKYDLIISNPPFTKNQDIDHIKKMYSLLAVGGQLITLSSTSWKTGSQKKQIAFRELLDEIEAEQRVIKAGTFKSSGTNIETIMLVINK